MRLKNVKELDVKSIWNVFEVDGFDLVVGNPPYDNGGRPAKPLYHLFCMGMEKISSKVLFVIPGRWLCAGLGLQEFRKYMFQSKQIKHITYFEKSKDVFGNVVDIKGGVLYYLYDNKYEGLCKLNGVYYDFNKYDVFVELKNQSKLDKILNVSKTNNLKFLNEICKLGGSYSGINTNDKRLKSNGDIKCYVSKQKGFIKYVNNDDIDLEQCQNYKVISSRAAFAGRSGFANMFLGYPNETCSHSYTIFLCNNEEEMKSLLSYLQTPTANWLLSLRKITQDITPKTCKWIPIPPLDRIWDEDNVLEYFKVE